MESNILCVWCSIFVGLCGLAFGQNWDIDYNRLEILQTDSHLLMSPQRTFRRNLHHNSRRFYGRRPAYNRNNRARAYNNEMVALRDRTNHQNNESNHMIYKAREDPSLFYKRKNSYNFHRYDENANEYAHEKPTLVHRKYHKIPENNQNYHIQTNSVFEPREDPSLFYEQNIRLDNNNRDIRNHTLPGKNVDSNHLPNMGFKYTAQKPPREFRQTGRTLVRKGETVHVVPDLHSDEQGSIVYNTPKLPSSINNLENQTVNSINASKDHHKKAQNDWQIEPNTNNEIIKPCIRCPYERTLVGKIGQDKVRLLKPKLMTCDGHKPGPAVGFERMYGPNFGTLLTEGSHLIVASVKYYGNEIQLCQFRVRVVLQRCPALPGITVQCDAPRERERLTRRDETQETTAGAGAWCDFTCEDATKHIVGSSTLMCGDDLQWKGTPPHCKVKTWCYRPEKPRHGRLVCRGRALTNVALANRSWCRAQCDRGLASRPPRAFCRSGKWTATLACEPATLWGT